MTWESAFEFIGLLATLAATTFFIRGYKEVFSPSVRIVFLILLINGGVKYLINGLEWSHVWQNDFVDLGRRILDFHPEWPYRPLFIFVDGM